MKKLIHLMCVVVLIAGCGSNGSESKSGSSGSNMKAKKPVNIDVLVAQGAQYINKGDIPEAIAVFDEVIKANPGDPRGYMILGETYMRLNNYERAIDTFSAALNVDPNNGNIHYLLAISFGQSGNLKKATEHAQKSVEIFQTAKDQDRFLKSVALLQGLLNTTN